MLSSKFIFLRDDIDLCIDIFTASIIIFVLIYYHLFKR